MTNFLKKLMLTITCLSSCSLSLADATQSAPGNSTNAIAFGIQAGQIAGAAQACGIDISVFTMRVGEAINKLAINATDRGAATDSFQKTLGQAQAMQSANHPIACSQVTQDFNSLPLLRPDYEQTVISQLNPGMNSNNTASTSSTPNTSTATAQGQATNNAANQQQTANNANMPNSNLNSQPGTATNTNTSTNTATNNNPAYGPANSNQYGAYAPTRNNYDNAINSLNTTNQQSLNSSSGSSSQPATTGTQQNPANTTNTNTTTNPPPPSFSNPNNAVTTTGGY